jgi:hypothetical protein
MSIRVKVLLSRAAAKRVSQMPKNIQPHYVSETTILHKIAGNPECSWIFTKHALEEMAADRWTAADVKFALTNGQVVLHEQKRDLLWRVEGTDIDGGKIRVVVAVNEMAIEIKVVTTF